MCLNAADTRCAFSIKHRPNPFHEQQLMHSNGNMPIKMENSFQFMPFTLDLYAFWLFIVFV